MHWFSLALLTAFFAATEAALAKRFLGDLRPLAMTACHQLSTLPFFIVLFLCIDKPPLAADFWQTVAVLLPLNMAGTLSYLAALQCAPISLTMPFLSFTPIIVAGSAYLMLGETPSWPGLVGILGVGLGSWILNFSGRRPRTLLAPLQALAHARGIWLMLLAAVVFGFTAVLGKKLILQSSPLYAVVVFFLIHNTLLGFGLLSVTRTPAAVLKTHLLPGLLVGLALMAHVICHFHGIALAPAAYMMSIKRLSVLFAVLYGGWLFKEPDILFRLAGAALMSAGAAVITLAG